MGLACSTVAQPNAILGVTAFRQYAPLAPQEIIGTGPSVIQLPRTPQIASAQAWLMTEYFGPIANEPVLIVTRYPCGNDTSCDPLELSKASISKYSRSSLAYKPDTRTIFIRCASTFHIFDLDEQYRIPYPLPPPVSIGIGTYSALYYRANSSLLFAGTSSGLGLVFNVSNPSRPVIKKLTLLPEPSNDPIISIFVDSTTPQSIVVFWGTNSGRLVRSDFASNLRVVTSASIVSTTDHPLTITHIMQHPKDNMKLIVTAGQRRNKSGTQNDLDGGGSSLFVTTKDNCAIWNEDCGSCGQSPYCGWCYALGCTSKSECPSNNVWSNNPVCPVTRGAFPMRADIKGASLIVLSGEFFTNGPITDYICYWSVGRGTPSPFALQVPPVSISSTIALCSFPKVNRALLLGPGDSVASEFELKYLGNTWGSAFGSFGIFDCAAYTDCDSCNTQTSFSECGWCFKSSSCSTKISCNFDGFSPDEAWTRRVCPIAANRTEPPSFSSEMYPVTGAGATQPSINFLVSHFPLPADAASFSSFSCIFSGASFNKSDITQYPSTQARLPPSTSPKEGDVIFQFNVTCLLPRNLAISSLSDYFVHLGYTWSIQGGGAVTTDVTAGAASAVRLYDRHKIYRCDICSNPLFPVCHWVVEDAVGSCRFQSEGISAESPGPECPSLSGIQPNSLQIWKMSVPTMPMLGLEGSSLNPTPALSCIFQLESEGNVTTLLTQATVVSPALVTCQVPKNPLFVVGNWEVGLSSSQTDPTSFLAPRILPIYDCDKLSDCGSCLAFADCKWCPKLDSLACSNSTSSQCPPGASLGDAAQCPTINAARPSDLLIGTSPDVTLAHSVPRPKETEKSRKERKVREFSSKIMAKRSSMASSSDYTYMCRWGALATVATWLNSGEIECDTPVISEIVRTNFNFDFALLLGRNTYASAPGSVRMDFYTCPTAPSEGCVPACPAADRCGWCMSSGQCTSNAACYPSNIASNSSDIDDGGGEFPETMWLPQCIDAKMSANSALVSGGGLVRVEFSSALPAFLDETKLSCRFGLATIGATFVEKSQEDNSIVAISCPVPASPTKTSYTGAFDVAYRSRRLTIAQKFSYVDCSRFSSCKTCQDKRDSLCGWCTVGTPRCTVASGCSTTSKSRWRRHDKGCPINVLAVVLGVILGTLFLLLLAALIAYLAIRAYKRRKAGLVIDLREPDYDLIAWGKDTVILYKLPPSRYSVLHAALCREDFILQLALALNCPSTEQDTLAKGLVYIACAHDTASQMIQRVIRAEVSACPAENQRFRSNSVASKMYKFYSRVVGIKYLFQCLARLILELEVLGKKSLARDPNSKQEVSLLNVTMELDMEKRSGSGVASAGFGSNGVALNSNLSGNATGVVEEDNIADNVDAETNLLQLQLICQKILRVIINRSTSNIPRALREIFVEIDSSAAEKFPGSTEAIYKGLGGLFFLRFVCPAITAPHVYGLLPSPPTEITQRQLVLIGKVIQSIANMSTPNNREGYMAPMCNFIESSLPRIRQFYDNLRCAANISNHSTIYERQIVVPEEVLMNGLAATQGVLVSESNKIIAWSQNQPENIITASQAQELREIIAACIDEEPTSSRPSGSMASPKTPGSSKKKSSKMSRDSSGSTGVKKRRTKSGAPGN